MRYLVLGERPQELCDLIMQDVLDEKARCGCFLIFCFGGYGVVVFVVVGWLVVLMLVVVMEVVVVLVVA